MRIGKALLVAAATLFFVLLLSTLVVTPAPASAAEATAPAQPARLDVQLLPLAMPTPEVYAESTLRPLPARAAALLPLASLAGIALLFKRDANGRVLCAKRYENSFYPLFRQEVAGG
ncbi:MAG: hypothetical protein RSB91_06500 [Clostridia bacterium]